MAPTGPPPGHFGLKNNVGHHSSLPPPPHSHGGGHYSTGAQAGGGGLGGRGLVPSGPPPPLGGGLNPALGALLQSLAGPLAALTAGNPQQTALLAQLGLGMNNNLNNNLNNNNNNVHQAALFGRGGVGALGAGSAGPNFLGTGPGTAGSLGSLGGLGQFGANGVGGAGSGAVLGGGLGATPGPASPSGVVLLVSNLPDGSLTPDDLFTLFGVYGDVIRVKILYNKKENALVQMADGTQVSATP